MSPKKWKDDGGDDGDGGSSIGPRAVVTAFERQQRSYQRRLELYTKEKMMCEGRMAKAVREGNHDEWHAAKARLDQVKKKIAKMKRLLFL